MPVARVKLFRKHTEIEPLKVKYTFSHCGYHRSRKLKWLRAAFEEHPWKLKKDPDHCHSSDSDSEESTVKHSDSEGDSDSDTDDEFSPFLNGKDGTLGTEDTSRSLTVEINPAPESTCCCNYNGSLRLRCTYNCVLKVSFLVPKQDE